MNIMPPKDSVLPPQQQHPPVVWLLNNTLPCYISYFSLILEHHYHHLS